MQKHTNVIDQAVDQAVDQVVDTAVDQSVDQAVDSMGGWAERQEINVIK